MADDRAGAWRAGALLGLLSSSYSTLVLQLGARQIGRDVALDWMNVGSIVFRDRGIRARPGWREIAMGIAIHQAADFGWALAFFGLGFGRLRRHRKAVLFGLLAPWAAATSATEYYLVLPWLQPIVPMDIPYWTALSAHLSSAAAYPLFFRLHELMGGRPARHSRLTRTTLAVLGGSLAALAGLAALKATGRDPRWPLVSEKGRTFDRTFLHHMTAHHERGVWLARLAAEKGAQEELRVLGRLMLGQHEAELGVMRQWWRRWFGGEIPPMTPEEEANMYGLPPREEVALLEPLSGLTFDIRYLPVMIYHHRGAISMADNAWRQGGDPRLRVFADSMRHAQRRQVARMEGLRRRATHALAASGGE